MELLFSNQPPMAVPGTSDFTTAFVQSLVNNSRVTMCTGYVATDAIVELQMLLEQSPGLIEFKLIVGMAKFDGLTRSQSDSLNLLNNFLTTRRLGCVYVAMAMPIHTKLAHFWGSETDETVILGSSNLGSLTKSKRQYEVDICFRNTGLISDQVNEFLQKAIFASAKFSDVHNDIPEVVQTRHPIEEIGTVRRSTAPGEDLLDRDRTFEIPISVGARSGLNAFFGKGRKSVAGRLLPRPWYEAELIVPKDITSRAGYPNSSHSNVFRVFTDDGFEFDCKTSGDNYKNFRSQGNLEILGRWIKGRLEASGNLSPGEIVTTAMLNNYGRSTLSLVGTKLSENDWLLDFSVDQHAT